MASIGGTSTVDAQPEQMPQGAGRVDANSDMDKVLLGRTLALQVGKVIISCMQRKNSAIVQVPL